MLIDKHLARWDVSERHEILVRTDAEAAYRAVREIDLGRSLPIALLFAVRGAPRLLTGKAKLSRRFTLETFREVGFTLLEEEPGSELVLGVVGRFWRPDGGIQRVDAERFASFEEPGFAQAVMNFRVEEDGPGEARVITETRVRCTDAGARRRFSLYWRVVGPFSGLIRRLMLREVKRSAEVETRSDRR